MVIARDPSIDGVVRMTATVHGPRVVFFSGIHGNEVSGVHAIEKLLFDFFARSTDPEAWRSHIGARKRASSGG